MFMVPPLALAPMFVGGELLVRILVIELFTDNRPFVLDLRFCHTGLELPSLMPPVVKRQHEYVVSSYVWGPVGGTDLSLE